MKDACPNPCSECPFRTNSLAGWLGEWEAQELSRHVLSDKYPCHKTMGDSGEYLDLAQGDQDLADDLLLDATQCRGAVLYREKNGFRKANGPEHQSILTIDEFLYRHNPDNLGEIMGAQAQAEQRMDEGRDQYYAEVEQHLAAKTAAELAAGGEPYSPPYDGKDTPY